MASLHAENLPSESAHRETELGVFALAANGFDFKLTEKEEQISISEIKYPKKHVFPKCDLYERNLVQLSQCKFS